MPSRQCRASASIVLRMLLEVPCEGVLTATNPAHHTCSKMHRRATLMGQHRKLQQMQSQVCTEHSCTTWWRRQEPHLNLSKVIFLLSASTRKATRRTCRAWEPQVTLLQRPAALHA